MKKIGLRIGKIRFNNIDSVVIEGIILLASFDLFRAYADIKVINAIFAVKEIVLIALFLYYLIERRTKIPSNIVYLYLISILYLGLNIRFDTGVLLYFVFLKYFTVYYIALSIVSICNIESEKKAIDILTYIFITYSFFSLIQGFLFPQYMVRAGRVSGFANPSYLSLIYLYLYLYWTKNNRILLAMWFVMSGCLTMTKTFFVISPVAIIGSLFISEKKKYLLSMIGIALATTTIIVCNNQEMLYTFDRAYKVLIERDANEYNSFEDRNSRGIDFEKYNSGNYFCGYGTASASAATSFVNEKFNIQIPHATDFENQYLNLYYSSGILGLILVYLPIILIFIKVLISSINFNKKILFYLYLIVFLLFGLTLNVIESFTSCIISLLFLIYEERSILRCDRLPHDSMQRNRYIS